MALKTKHSIITTLPEDAAGIQCSAQAGMTIVNGDIYCISSQSSNTNEKKPVVLRKLFGYLSGSTSSSKAVIIHTAAGTQNIAIHANSLTYYNHVFYLATMNAGANASQVMAFGSDGEITAKYTYSDGEKNTITTINYYDTKDGALRFLVSIGHGVNVKFRLVKADGTVLKDEGISFTASVPDSNFLKGNDHYYDRSTKQLYVTKFKTPPTDGDITTNWILQYDLSDGISKPEYSSVRTLEASILGDEIKFEIEGLCIYDNKKYVCTNTVILQDKKRTQEDAICKLFLA